MKKAIKNFGLGLVYFAMIPLLAVFLCIEAVFGLGIFLGKSLVGIVRFFKGDKFFKELPEDARVLEIKIYRESLQTGGEEKGKEPNPETHVYVQQNYYQPNPNQSFPNQPPFPDNNPYLNQNPGPQINPQMNQMAGMTNPQIEVADDKGMFPPDTPTEVEPELIDIRKEDEE